MSYVIQLYLSYYAIFVSVLFKIQQQKTVQIYKELTNC